MWSPETPKGGVRRGGSGGPHYGVPWWQKPMFSELPHRRFPSGLRGAADEPGAHQDWYPVRTPLTPKVSVAPNSYFGAILTLWHPHWPLKSVDVEHIRIHQDMAPGPLRNKNNFLVFRVVIEANKILFTPTKGSVSLSREHNRVSWITFPDICYWIAFI